MRSQASARDAGEPVASRAPNAILSVVACLVSAFGWKGCTQARHLRDRATAAWQAFHSDPRASSSSGGLNEGLATSVKGATASAAPAAPSGPEAGPDRASGPDASREGAQALRIGTPLEGSVSFEEGDRTDWYRLEPPAPGLVQLEFSAQEAMGLEASLVDKGQERPLRSLETLEIFKPREVLVRVRAVDPLARGAYRMFLSDVSRLPASLKGIVLRFNGLDATLDLGAEDGVREGLRGVVVRRDATQVPFVVKKVLRRTCRAETDASLGPDDLGAQAHVVGTQAALPGRAE